MRRTLLLFVPVVLIAVVAWAAAVPFADRATTFAAAPSAAAARTPQPSVLVSPPTTAQPSPFAAGRLPSDAPAASANSSSLAPVAVAMLARDPQPARIAQPKATDQPWAPADATPQPIATPEPTPRPTAEPTARPTAEPTARPTAEPTARPTAEPTARPTAEPTARPTAEPTARPTAEPTPRPTAEPTPLPTQTYTGTSRFWYPALDIEKNWDWYGCDYGGDPNGLGPGVYRWGCGARNNVYLLGHAWSTFAALRHGFHDGSLQVGQSAWYADEQGAVSQWTVQWIRRVTDDYLTATANEWASNDADTPIMTLQTCDGADSQYRLIVRLVPAG